MDLILKMPYLLSNLYWKTRFLSKLFTKLFLKITEILKNDARLFISKYWDYLDLGC